MEAVMEAAGSSSDDDYYNYYGIQWMQTMKNSWMKSPVPILQACLEPEWKEAMNAVETRLNSAAGTPNRPTRPRPLVVPCSETGTSPDVPAGGDTATNTTLDDSRE